MTATSEFGLIDAFVAAFAEGLPARAMGMPVLATPARLARHGVIAPASTLVLGPGDDAALLRVPAGELLVATTDTLVCGRHFLQNMLAEHIGWRALAVNLSDLAAMGARPLSVLVALTLPEPDAAWLRACGHGMGSLAMQHGVTLAGGNMSRGQELSISVTALGSVRADAALRRSGASVGDGVFVSGRIGCAGAGLITMGQMAARARTVEEWTRVVDTERAAAAAGGPDPIPDLLRYLVPVPRCLLGVLLRRVASAAIDVSDGLLADLGHLCAASGVAARIVAAQVPVTNGLPRADALRAGDDYELCFTVPAAHEQRLDYIARRTQLDLTRIGVITEGNGLWLDGERVLDSGGYRHFQ